MNDRMTEIEKLILCIIVAGIISSIVGGRFFVCLAVCLVGSLISDITLPLVRRVQRRFPCLLPRGERGN